jgi:hypothetical protein
MMTPPLRLSSRELATISRQVDVWADGGDPLTLAVVSELLAHAIWVDHELTHALEALSHVRDDGGPEAGS